ncbi:MAG: CocE/NonD family hydrolase [Gemmatimonadales bacterium]
MPGAPAGRLLTAALTLASFAAVAPAEGQVEVRFAVTMPMRDGVELVADAWIPEGLGPFPTILVRTPYERTMELLGAGAGRPPELGTYFAKQGYVWIIQDTRGRGDSEGTFHFFRDDGPDGYDSIEWIARQPWSNGRVCTMGVSYLGTVQWLAAKERPPHLVCMASTAAAGRWLDELPYLGGALQVQFMLGWTYRTAGRTYAGANAVGLDWMEIYRHRPLLTMDDAVGRRIEAWREFVEHSTYDDHWKRISLEAPRDFETLDLPTLHVTGLFDWDQPGAMYYWRAMQAHSPAATHQYLLLGPWTHPQTWTGGLTSLGEWRLGAGSVVDYKPIHLAFFDRYLKGSTDRFDFPRARVFLTGTNQWRDTDAYPPRTVRTERLFLSSGGRANSLAGDGRLSFTTPAAEPPDRFTADPDRPVPSSVGTADPRGVDHRPIERRDDVLVYTSERLTDTLTIVGNVFVTLTAATDGRDTDFTAKLLDVGPDEVARKLGPTEVGVIRARYRKGRDRTELLEPGAVERYRIELFDVAHAFLPGHRIRLEIASAAFPFIDVNTNTGLLPATDTTSRVARQTVYHDRERLSFVELPVWRR